MVFFLSFWLIILLLRYNITNIRCDCGQYTRKFPLGTLNCIIHSMDVLYYPPPLASGNITHLCNSRYLGKIFLYIDHNHMEYLYNIMTSRSAATLVWVWKHAVIYSLSMKTIPVPISEVRKHYSVIADPFTYWTMIKINTLLRSILHFIMLNYGIIIEECVLPIKKLHGLV